MNGSLPLPGEYSFTELGDAFGVSRKTAEAYKDRFKLQYKEVYRNNRAVHGVVLTTEDIESILASITPSTPKLFLPEVVQDVSAPQPEPSRMAEEGLLDEYKNRMEGYQNRIEEFQSENSQLKTSLESLRNENMNEKIKSARLDKDVEKLEALIAQLNIRLDEKDQVIGSLRAHIDAEKSRADSFNNQIRGLNDKVQTMRNGNSPEDLERWMRSAYEKQKIEIAQMLSQKLQSQSDEVKSKKGFRLFGFEISKAPSRWEGISTQRRVRRSRQRPHHY